MRILVISSTPWNTNNSFGNSYSNIFRGMRNHEFANIYCMEGMVNESTVSRAFQITPKALVQHIFDAGIKTGREVAVTNETGSGAQYSKTDQKVLQFAKKHRWKIMFWAKEAIWSVGKWNTPELERFVKEFDPELLFVPIYGSIYMNRIIFQLHKMIKVPMLGYISDDHYTLRQFSLSPVFWIDRLIRRTWVRKVIDSCRLLYVISDIQKQEYDKIFNKNCHILTKGFDFKNQSKPETKENVGPYHLLYAGNIGGNRWKSLARIGEAIKKINASGQKMELTIYTATVLTKTMEKKLNIPDCIRVAGCIPYSEIAEKQREADILVHVEATDIRYRWSSHQGFSTKLVDYMASNRPILAYGLPDQASIAHLKKQDAAFVAGMSEELEDILAGILKDPELLHEYAAKAWGCGRRCHDINQIHEMLEEDFAEVLKK